MTERENLLRVINKQEPAWLPRKGVLPYPDADPEEHKPCSIGVRPEIFPPKRGPKGGRIDMFGVEYEGAENICGQELPMPNKFILDDVRKWRDIIKVPSLDGVDWRAIAEKAVANVDRHESCVQMGGTSGFFQQLMSFMGFTEGLCALQEEPEECMALFDYLCTYNETVAKNLIGYIKPEIYGVSDDTATARSPFISREMYRNIIMPFHARMAKIGSELGLPIDMHCCGRCEDFIEDWREFGVTFWNPAQITNDLVGIKAKYGNRLVIAGGWDGRGRLLAPDVTEEEIRQSVRDTMDAYAVSGGFCWAGGFMGALGDPEPVRKNDILKDEARKYGATFYKK